MADYLNRVAGRQARGERYARMCASMAHPVLVTKHLYPEAIELLGDGVELDYHDSRSGLSPEDLLARARGKEGVVCQLTDKFSADVFGERRDIPLLPFEARLPEAWHI